MHATHLKTLNIAQRLAARKLLVPELHPEFPEDSRAYVFHLALCVHRACESRCSAAGIVPLNLWLSCVFPFVVPKRSRYGQIKIYSISFKKNRWL